MTQRLCFTILLCYIGVLSAKAQLSKQDSIRLHNLLNGDGEININLEAVKDIHFDFNPSKELMKSKPVMSEEKRWMDYLEDLPKNYLDTVVWKKQKYIRMLPYTVYTKHNENPVLDPIIKDRKDTLSIKFKIHPQNIPGLKNGYRVVPKGMDQSVTPSNNPLVSFSAEDMLAPIFSKKARTRRKNAKNANAWKTYEKTLPQNTELFKDKKPGLKGNDPLKNDTLHIKTDSLFFLKKDSLSTVILQK